MSSREDLDVDDDFREIYKAYTGPLGFNVPNTQEKTATSKRSRAGSDEEEETRDPNAVPTDFTSREAKVWEAKSKATERNWKKRKEEEMICKICGVSGHFTQGCPSTLGANRKSQDFFERVPARDPHIKALFTDEVLHKVEEDIGCKIKIEEKFIIVSGKDRLILKKGVDAVHKIKEDGEKNGIGKSSDEAEAKVNSSSPIIHSRSRERRSPATSRWSQSDYQNSNPSPRDADRFPGRYSKKDKIVEDSVRKDLQKLSSGSPHARAYDSDGGQQRSSHLKSPAHFSYIGNSYNSYEGHAQGRVGSTDGWNDNRGAPNMQSSLNVDFASFPQTLEELELQYKKEAMELAKIRDKEEDEENCRHREAVREMRESYMEKVTKLKSSHSNMWAEFLHLEGQRRQKQSQPVSTSEFGAYKQPSHQEFDNSSGNLHHSGASVHSRIRYPSTMSSYDAPRPHDTYHEFQRHRHDDIGKPYNRY